MKLPIFNPLLEEADSSASDPVEAPRKRKEEQRHEASALHAGKGGASTVATGAIAASESLPVNKEADTALPATSLKASAASTPFSKCVPDGALVVLKDFAGRRKLARADSNEQPAQSAFALDARVLVGSPYGSTFSWMKGTWVRTQRPRPLEREFAARPSEEGCEVDNRDICDSNSAQKLSATEIEALRSHTSADQLVRQIVANSETFERRSNFAKQKYIARKAKKHIRQYTVLEATLRELCEFHYSSNPTKIIGLRHDYLSALLQAADLAPHQRVLVLDHALGFATAGVLTRLADSGQVYRLVESGFVGDRALRELNAAASLSTQRLVDVNVEHMYKVLFEEKDEGEKTPPEAATNSCGDPSVLNCETKSAEALSPSQQREKSLALRDQSLRQAAEAAVASLGASQGLSSFVCAISPFRVQRGSDEESGLTVDDLTRRLLYKALRIGNHFLRPGGRVVVFSQAFEFVASTHAALCASADFLNVHFEELLLREMQVVPGRTHPVMESQVAIPSGFLLSATKVAPLNSLSRKSAV